MSQRITQALLTQRNQIHILMPYHTNCNNLLIGLRGFSSNGARTSQVLNPKTFVLPNDVSDDVPVTDGHSDEDRERANLYCLSSKVSNISISWIYKEPMIYCTWTLHLPLHGDSEQRWWSWYACSPAVSGKGTWNPTEKWKERIIRNVKPPIHITPVFSVVIFLSSV